MWIDDLDVVESCDFYRSLLNFDSIDSLGVYAATNTFAYMKAPTQPPSSPILLLTSMHSFDLLTVLLDAYTSILYPYLHLYPPNHPHPQLCPSPPWPRLTFQL